MPDGILVALGGHALLRPGQSGFQQQAGNLDETLGDLVELIRQSNHVVITHGNGPQVGHILIRVEESRGKAYDLPLDACVAQSQGEIGYLIQQSLENVLRRNGLVRRTLTVLCRTLIDRDDPCMKDPTKPVGPFYTKEHAAVLSARGWRMRRDAEGRYRRVVPSPRPLHILETELIRRTFEDGTIVIAAGGGGIPVALPGDHELVGVEAVVDKDFTSGMLASAIGVERILDLTAVEHAKLHFGSRDERDLDRLTIAEAKTYLADGQFAEGSMGPKIEAAIQFLERGGREVIITRADRVLQAWTGQTGTHLRPDEARDDTGRPRRP